MTLVDTNLLIYATLKDAPEHELARSWLAQQLAERDEGVVLCWPVLYAFLRLLTNPRVLGPHAVPVREGWAVVDAYLDQPAARLAAPGIGHRATAAELAQTPGLRSDDAPDLEIAALAIEHGLVLATHDSGFRRFAGLRVVDPLEQPDERR